MSQQRDELGYVPTEQAAVVKGSERGTQQEPSSIVARSEPVSRSSGALAWLHAGTTLAGRFEIVRMIGTGGMGVVYEARDLERNAHVALKTLHREDPFGVYRFKNEFRSLTDVQHPNLVRLYEMFFDGEHWFFTMELVLGTRFDQWVRPQGQLDAGLLRAALLQLVDAIDAIHRAGKLHRDLKPNNVLVTAPGRVVVLDFGLVAEPRGGRGQTLMESSVMGTPDYMAPEQAAGLPADAASDYYSIGVMLFESLTGRLPFEGSPGAVLAAKQRDRAPTVREFAQGAPACDDLLNLCDELLSRVPAERPGAEAIRARVPDPVRTTSSAAVSSGSGSVRPSAIELARPLGRARELAQLREAYRASEAGHAVIVTIVGESGIGKTALCQAFLDELRSEGHAVVLAGRCYEQESIPFKVLDPMLDDLSRQLRRLDSSRAAALLPRDAYALAQLFPGLTRVEAFAQAPVRQIADAQERERRALAALHELFARIRDRQPLVVHLDDLQWMDADSAKALRYLLVRRTPVPLLLLACFRTQDAERNPWLCGVLQTAHRNRSLEMQALDLGPLSPADAESLARRVLTSAELEDGNVCAAIARQAAGSPFFVTELAHFALERRGRPPVLSLQAVIDARIGELPGAARRMLEVLAVAGRPLPLQVTLTAANANYEAVDRLRTAHLLRSSNTRARLIDCYHDRIREQVRQSLDERSVSDACRRLAEVLSGRADADPELLSRCLEQSGDRAGAAHCLIVAAQRAFDAMAFDHAAALYGRVLADTDLSGEQRRELTERHGDALAHAGRGAEAAAAYVRAASLLTGEAALELRRRAAEQLLGTGHVETGTAVLRDVCQELGLYVPLDTSSALLSLAGTRARVYLSNLSFEPKSVTANSRESLRLRTARTLVTGLLPYLPLQGASTADRYLLMALAGNDRSELTRALGFTLYCQTLLRPGSKRLPLLLTRMDELAASDGSRELRGFANLMRGMAAFHQHACKLAATHLATALQDIRGCPGMEWENDAARVYEQMSALYLGQCAQLVRATPTLIEDAFRRGRVWAGVMLSGFAGMLAWVCLDDPQGYRAQLRDARGHWIQQKPVRWPDYFLLVGEALLEIYTGNPARGFMLLSQHYREYRRSRLTTGVSVGASNYAGHVARCAASALRSDAAARSRMDREQLRQTIADAQLRQLRTGTVMGQGVAYALRAALAFDDGKPARASRALRRAIAAFDEAELMLCAAAARRRLGQLLGGEGGRALIAAGDEFMIEQGVKNIEAMTELTCPGCRS